MGYLSFSGCGRGVEVERANATASRIVRGERSMPPVPGMDGLACCHIGAHGGYKMDALINPFPSDMNIVVQEHPPAVKSGKSGRWAQDRSISVQARI